VILMHHDPLHGTRKARFFQGVVTMLLLFAAVSVFCGSQSVGRQAAGGEDRCAARHGEEIAPNRGADQEVMDAHAGSLRGDSGLPAESTEGGGVGGQRGRQHIVGWRGTMPA